MTPSLSGALRTIPERVLVLDGHTNQALACVRSLARAGLVPLIASHRRLPLGAWSRYCRGQFRLAGETVEDFAALRTWAQEQGVTIVLPATERACVLCNAERHKWEAAGILVGCTSEETLARAFDKARTVQAAQVAGVRIPPTRIPRSLLDSHAAAAEVGFPCVVKSRFSNAWDGATFLRDRGTTYLTDPSGVEAAVLAHRQGEYWPLIQGFVHGQGKGVCAVCDRGVPVAWFAHERLRDVRPTGSGSSLRRSIALESRLCAPAERLLAELQWHGPAMVEFRDDGTQPPCLIEVNGRFWGSLQLAISSGADFPKAWIAVLRGRTVEATAAYESGVTLRWLWGDVKRLMHILAGPPPGYPLPYPTRMQGIAELLASQPPGTRAEIWDQSDPWPAVGEWIQGIGELVTRRRDSHRVAGDAPKHPLRTAGTVPRRQPADLAS